MYAAALPALTSHSSAAANSPDSDVGEFHAKFRCAN